MFKKLLLSLTLFTFAIAFTTAQTIGLIGSATPDGWDSDQDMVQDAGNPDLWTLSIDLVTGAAKFRADDDWAMNWGAADFPSGTGDQDGPDIPVPGGSYDITFNSATGEYTFTYTGLTYGTVGVIGDATPTGWDSDTDMNPVGNAPWVYTLEMSLVAGGVKFRADDDWVDSWGSLDWPAGVGLPGGDNVPAEVGDYLITFNASTGEYNFETLIPIYSTIGIIGDATPNGWDSDTDLMQNPTNPSLWSANITFTDGVAKFRAEDDWPVNWGSLDFPMGVGVQDGDDIPVVAGEYNVTFNSATGEYNFGSPIAIYNTIGIIGDALPTGWDSDLDMVQNIAQPDEWSIEITLIDGSLKFRADDDWAVNWGDGGFPTGTGTMGGDNIPVFTGTWEVLFNATTGVYSFTPVSIGIIGSALVGGWDTDEDMDCSAAQGNFWTTQKDLADGDVKFRKNDDWPVNWGSADFPIGVGTQDGDNIPVPAGLYDISINTATGDYVFETVNGTTEVLNPNSVKVFPNPTANVLNVTLENEKLHGNITVNLMDGTGRILETQTHNGATNLSFNVSDYSNGVYILQITSENFIIGKKVMVTK